MFYQSGYRIKTMVKCPLPFIIADVYVVAYFDSDVSADTPTWNGGVYRASLIELSFLYATK